MTYVALLRGINVGGNNRVEMVRLAGLFHLAGLSEVKTYINTGNVIFKTNRSDIGKLQSELEATIQAEFGFAVPVLLRSLSEIEQVIAALPAQWVNDQATKCDVMFLWPTINQITLPEQLAAKPHIDSLLFLPGTVIWHVNRNEIARSALLKIVGTKLYKQMTIRNCNTVRKLHTLMLQADEIE